MNSIEDNKYKLTCCNYIFVIICGVITFLMFLSMPISEIYLGIVYANSIRCNTTLFVNLSLWLIIKGFISIFVVICMTIIIMLGKNSLYSSLFYCLLFISSIITFAWLIIGSIIFWRDCYDLTPKFINTFIWVSLIFGYLSLLTTSQNLNN